MFRNVTALRGKSNSTKIYTKDKLLFPSSKVQYSYSATNQSHDLFSPLKDKKMTGFQLNWFIQDSNGRRMTKMIYDAALKCK